MKTKMFEFKVGIIESTQSGQKLPFVNMYIVLRLLLYEPRREKTGLRGFRPGPTQTGLYKLRKELEA